MASPSPDPARTPVPVDHDMPPQSSDEPPVGAVTGSRPILVGDCGDAVAFLDAPGLGAQELLDAVNRVLATMPNGAILTVFTDDPTAPDTAASWSTDHRIELVAVIPHGGLYGMTLAFRRAEPESGSDATGVARF